MIATACFVYSSINRTCEVTSMSSDWRTCLRDMSRECECHECQDKTRKNGSPSAR